MVTMSHDDLQALIAGYALDILDVEEKKLLEAHLPTCAACQADLAPLQGVASDLALSLEPMDLPAGHLERFRAKAGVAPTFSRAATTAPRPPIAFEQARRRRFNPIWAVAAALLVTVIAGVLGGLLLDANQRLNQQQQSTQALAGLLASPNLKVSELKPTGTGQAANARVLADPDTNKVVLVSYNLQSLPDDKSYEVWAIGGENSKPQSVAVFSRKDATEPAIVSLNLPKSLGQYQLFAITVEQRGGSPTSGPTTQPFIAGNLA